MRCLCTELRCHLPRATTGWLFFACVKNASNKIHLTCQNRCNWQWKLFILCALVLKGIYNLFVTARGYANCKINSNLLTLAAFWKWKYQRDYLNKTGGNISPRPQINSRNYPRDLLNSVFWQRHRFYSQLFAILVGMCVRGCVYIDTKKALLRGSFLRKVDL